MPGRGRAEGEGEIAPSRQPDLLNLQLAFRESGKRCLSLAPAVASSEVPHGK